MRTNELKMLFAAAVNAVKDSIRTGNLSVHVKSRPE